MDMLKQLVDSKWLNLIFFVCGAALTWLFQKLGRAERVPCYISYNEELIGDNSILAPDVEIKHLGRSLPRVTLTRVVFWNAGREPIRPDDLLQDDPIAIRLPRGSSLIRASVRRAAPAAAGFFVQPETIRNGETLVHLRFAFLDRGHHAVIDILHTGGVNEEVKISGTVIGVPAGIRHRRAPEGFLSRRGRSGARDPRSAVVMGLVGLLALLAAVLSLRWESVYPLPPNVVLAGVSVLCSAACFNRALKYLYPTRMLPFPEALLDTQRRDRTLGGRAVAQDVFCSGVGGSEEFIDTDESRKPAVVLPRRPQWNPVAGAEYVWARRACAFEEERDGCKATLIRTFRLGGSPRLACLTLQVDDEADVHLNSREVQRGLRGARLDPHEIDVSGFLRQGDNELRIVVHNHPMNKPDLKPGDNPTGVAYRLEVSY